MPCITNVGLLLRFQPPACEAAYVAWRGGSCGARISSACSCSALPMSARTWCASAMAVCCSSAAHAAPALLLPHFAHAHERVIANRITSIHGNGQAHMLHHCRLH